jgi:hypothetical protein
MNRRRVGAGVLFALLVVAGLGPRAAVAAEPVSFSQAAADVRTLGEQIRDKKQPNADLLGTIAAIEAAFFRLDPPPEPAVDGPLLVRQWQVKALDQLFDALQLVRVSPRDRRNVRDDVNLRAAEALGSILGSKDLGRLRDTKEVAALRSARAQQLMAVVATDLGRTAAKDRDVPQALLDAVFVALARTNDPKALDWLAKEFVHTRGGAFEEARLLAAHKAMTLFTNVPGRKRYDIAEVMIRLYDGTAASAKQATPEGRTHKAFWDHVRVGVIAAINHFATPPGGGPPTDAAGLGLTSVEELSAWWRAHKKPTQAPWLDPKAPK